jgi:hypothetical protein
MAGEVLYIDIQGMDKVIQSINQGYNRYQYRFYVVLRQAGFFILRESDKEVPIDTGELWRSRRVLRTGQGFKTVVTAGYGNPNSPAQEYAVYVHEMFGIAHGEAYNVKYAARIAAGKDHMRRPGEKYKYLEDPVNRIVADGSLAMFIYLNMVRDLTSSRKNP